MKQCLHLTVGSDVGHIVYFRPACLKAPRAPVLLIFFGSCGVPLVCNQNKVKGLTVFFHIYAQFCRNQSLQGFKALLNIVTLIRVGRTLLLWYFRRVLLICRKGVFPHHALQTRLDHPHLNQLQ